MCSLQMSRWKECDECENADATKFCPGCDLVYCDECDTLRHKKGSFQKHHRLPICDRCEGKPAEIQCPECSLGESKH